MTDKPEPQVSEKTRLEQELGRKLAAENAAQFDRAVAARAAEEAPPEEQQKADEDGMAAATAEAEAEAVAQGRGFPHAKEPYQPNRRKSQ